MAKATLTWVEKRLRNRFDDGREYHSTDGRFVIDVGWFCGERSGDRTAFIAKDKVLKGYRWGTQLNHAAAWCEMRAQGLNRDVCELARELGRVRIQRLPRTKETSDE